MANGTAKVTVSLTHGKKTYYPNVVSEIRVEWTRFGSPGKMTMTVLADSVLKFAEGDVVRLKVDDRNFFFGFIFTIERREKNQYALTIYDALRYLKSDDIFKMPKQTYTKALKKVLKRYGLKAGTIQNTKYVRKAKVFNGCIFDMLEDYRQSTRKSKGTNYILFANYNKVCLKSQKSMRTDYVMNAQLMEDFTYTSSIDDKVYTVVKLYKGSDKKPKVYTKTVKAAKKKYGRLTYVEQTKLKSKSKIKKKLKTIAAAHDSPRKKLTLNSVFGLTDIRAGSGVIVKLSDNGMKVSKRMTVDTVTHVFSEGRHTMNMNVVGGDYKNG